MMFYFLLFCAITTSVHGTCTNHTCVYGQCVDNECHCDPGVKGKTCNMDIIDCDSKSCFNDGTCIELMNGFACRCLPDFDGPRCQHRRRKNDNFCQKKCFNQGKCIVSNNQEQCLCSPYYFGSQCEFIQSNNTNQVAVRKCSILRVRNSRNVGTCLAISLTPLFDVLCECQYDIGNRDRIHCQLTPTAYSNEKCFFKTKHNSILSTTLGQVISIPVCPVSWQLLDQYEKQEETVNYVHITQCQLV